MTNKLKVSERQTQGLPPLYDGYYDQDHKHSTTGRVYRRAIKDPLAHACHVGLIVKISGDEDPELESYNGCWGIVSHVIDPYHFEVSIVGDDERIIIRDTDVAFWVADEQHLYSDLGQERHKKEIVPLIQAWKAVLQVIA